MDTNHTLPVAFSWRLPQGGSPGNHTRGGQFKDEDVGLPPFEAQVAFCKNAEAAGIKSVLIDISYAKPDPMVLATALAMHTDSVELLIAVRSGLITPTYFVKQINTLSVLSNGRVRLNVVAGYNPVEQHYYGDWLPHDERYDRTEEFLAITKGLWNGNPVDFKGNYYHIEQAQLGTPFVASSRTHPYTYVAGGSEKARNLAISHGDCWMRFPDKKSEMETVLKETSSTGTEVGFRCSVMIRNTAEEALHATLEATGLNNKASHQQMESSFQRQTDSQSFKEYYEKAIDEWLDDHLWSGAVRSHGTTALALVGTPEEISDTIIEYRQLGVTQYILAAWGKEEEMLRFGQDVIPLVREKEKYLKQEELL